MINKSYSESLIAYALLDVLKKYDDNADLMESMKIIAENLHAILGGNESIPWLELAEEFDEKWGAINSGDTQSIHANVDVVNDIKSKADLIYSQANNVDANTRG